MFRNIFSLTTQVLVWFFTTPLYWVFFKMKVTGREKLKEVKGPIIIVSNHIGWHDPWFILCVLGLKSPLIPLRFMATKRFIGKFKQFLYDIGFIPLVYFLFGAFTIEEGKGIAANLIMARDILRRDGTVIIFPEGSMNRGGSQGKFLPFKKGAAALAIEEGVFILPIYIKRTYNNIKSGNSLGWRDELTATIGSVFKIESEKSLEEGTEMVRKAVVGLYK